MSFCRWSIVRAFGNVTYFNISYGVLFGVPIAHELYVQGIPLMQLLGSPAPFPTTLRWIYGASFAFAIAIAIYQWRCPNLVKRFGRNESEYLESEYEIYQRALPKHRLNVVLANLDPELDRLQYQNISSILGKMNSCDAEERVKLSAQLDTIVGELHPDAVQRFLLKNYERIDMSEPFLRFASFALYILGTLVLIVLLLWRSYKVLLIS